MTTWSSETTAARLAKRLLAAYIHESARSDCDPRYRFRATLPDGSTAWAATARELAQKIIDMAGVGDELRID